MNRSRRPRKPLKGLRGIAKVGALWRWTDSQEWAEESARKVAAFEAEAARRDLSAELEPIVSPGPWWDFEVDVDYYD